MSSNILAMPSRLRDLCNSALPAVGIIGASEARVVGPSNVSEAGSYWEQWSGGSSYFHNSLSTAYGLCAGGRNEVLLLTPESHAQAAQLTFSKNMTHVVGMYGEAFQNQRSRIGHTVTLPQFITVSGYGNTFANLYFPYGVAAADINLLTVTGLRNTFRNCHFLPSLATALDDAGYNLVSIQGEENYFKNCYFGGDTVAWTNGCMLDFGPGGGVPRTVFENCVFVMNGDNGQVRFIKTTEAMGRCTIFFKNCQFVNLGTANAYAINGAGLTNSVMVFDSNSFFCNVTEVVEVGMEARVHLAPSNTPINQVTGSASVALFNGLSCHPDVS